MFKILQLVTTLPIEPQHNQCPRLLILTFNSFLQFSIKFLKYFSRSQIVHFCRFCTRTFEMESNTTHVSARVWVGEGYEWERERERVCVSRATNCGSKNQITWQDNTPTKWSELWSRLLWRQQLHWTRQDWSYVCSQVF